MNRRFIHRHGTDCTVSTAHCRIFGHADDCPYSKPIWAMLPTISVDNSQVNHVKKHEKRILLTTKIRRPRIRK